MLQCLDPEILDLENSGGCADDFVEVGAIIKASDIDLDAMKNDPTKFDTVNQVVKDWVLKPGKTWTRINPSLKDTIATETYTESAKLYDILTTFVFSGSDVQRRLAIQNLVTGCGYVVVVFSQKCKSKVYGLDYSAKYVSLKVAQKPISLSRHVSDMGKVGSEGSTRDEIDLTGKAQFAAMFADVAYSDMGF